MRGLVLIVALLFLPALALDLVLQSEVELARETVFLSDVTTLSGSTAQIFGPVELTRLRSLGECRVTPALVRTALAKSGVTDLTITGECRVKRGVEVWDSERLNLVAQEHLKSRAGAANLSVTVRTAARRVVLLADSTATTAAIAEALSDSFAPEAPYRVRLVRDGKELERVLVVFTVQAFTQRPVALRPVKAGATLGPQDIGLERVPVKKSQDLLEVAPETHLGKIARRDLTAGTVLDEAATAKALFVRNGQKIVLLFRSETFVLGSDATALGDASEGATVRVRTLSGKIVEGTAIAAGQVQAK